MELKKQRRLLENFRMRHKECDGGEERTRKRMKEVDRGQRYILFFPGKKRQEKVGTTIWFLASDDEESAGFQMNADTPPSEGREPRCY